MARNVRSVHVHVTVGSTVGSTSYVAANHNDRVNDQSTSTITITRIAPPRQDL